ncbi:MAG: sigma-70 family RNA polymerase sigma factor [Polyangiaceae bacterium]
MTAVARAVTAAAPTSDRIAELFRQHYAWVWRLIRRLGVDPGQVDDVAQQVFLIANDKLPQIEPGRERAFLAAVAQRTSANARRGLGRRKDTADESEIARSSSDGTPEQLLDWKQRRATLDTWLDALPESLRTPFVLFELEGHSLQEIAEILEQPVGTVKTRLRRARALFVEAAGLAQGGGEP